MTIICYIVFLIEPSALISVLLSKKIAIRNIEALIFRSSKGSATSLTAKWSVDGQVFTGRELSEIDDKLT